MGNHQSNRRISGALNSQSITGEIDSKAEAQLARVISASRLKLFVWFFFPVLFFHPRRSIDQKLKVNSIACRHEKLLSGMLGKRQARYRRRKKETSSHRRGNSD